MDLGSFLPALIAGTVLGILSGLGVGGGSLLLLWLHLGAKMDPAAARGVSLLFFFPAAVLSCILRRSAIPWSQVLPGALAGGLSAALFSLLAMGTDPDRFTRLLGVLLFFTGIQELRYRPKK